MRIAPFRLQEGELEVYQSAPARVWLAVPWKLISGILTGAVITYLLFTLLSSWMSRLIASVVSESAGELITTILLLGFVPLLAAGWVADDVASVFTSACILTNQRLWVHGSPHAWSHEEIPIEDIDALSFRKGALFIRRRSIRKIQVFMIPDARQLHAAYKRMITPDRDE
jgi:hypothetical protein